MRYPGKSLKDIEQCLDLERAERSILTFGEYDRLQINTITEPDRFRDLSDLAKNWVGNRQSFLLYELPGSPSVACDLSGEYPVFRWKDEDGDSRDRHLFWALTEFPFQNYLRTEDYSTLHQEAVDRLMRIVEEYNQGKCEGSSEPVRFLPLGSQGMFGICVLWFCDQYTDVLRLVDQMKRESKNKDGAPVYMTAYTLFSKNPMYNQSPKDDDRISRLEGKALLQLTLKNSIRQKELMQMRKILTGCGAIRHSSGEYDIAVEINAKNAYVDFEKNPLFDHDSAVYQNNILQTRIMFMDELQIEEDAGPEDFTDGVTASFSTSGSEDGSTGRNCNPNPAKEMNQIRDIYIAVRNELKAKVDKSAGIVDTLDALLCDYRYNMASSSNHNWAADLSHVFMRNLECMQDMLSQEMYHRDFMEIMRTMMNHMKQQIFHISEANSLHIEVPKCHLRYTGQEDAVLFAYMGIIKEILETAYNLESKNRQTEIVPLISVDMVPIIESELYFDKALTADEDDDDQEFKILALNLPHVTFYDIPLYIQYLYHEIYHYIVPLDREERDYNMGILLTSVFFENILHCMLAQFCTEKSDLGEGTAAVIKSYMRPLVYQVTLEKYIEIHEIITGFQMASGKKDTDKVLLIEKRYTKKLCGYLSQTELWLNSWMRLLLQKMDEGSVSGISFEGLEKRLGGDRKAESLATKIRSMLSGAMDLQPTDKDSWLQDITAVLRWLTQGMEEVSADIPMIELAKMPLEDFLFLYVQCLRNVLKKPQNIDLTLEMKEVVRLGVVFDFYGVEESELPKYEEKFVNLYVARNVEAWGHDWKTVWRKIETRRKEALQWWDFFKKCMERYQKELGLYQLQNRKISRSFSVENRINGYNIEEKVDFYFGENRKLYLAYSAGLAEAEEIYVKNQTPENEKKAEKICRDAGERLNSGRFSENIKLVHHFQNQTTLSGLCQKNRDNNLKKQVNPETYTKPKNEVILQPGSTEVRICTGENTAITVYSLRDFIEAMDRVTGKLVESCRQKLGREYPLWYRGHSDDTYGLLPGIMRSGTGNTERMRFRYLAQYQRFLFEEFKFRADGSPEVMDRSFFSISDYLALMQHYQVKTSLMDWSEDAFTSLYFAEEDLVNTPKLKANKNAAVFVFSPHLYNEARREMMNEADRNVATKDRVYVEPMKTAERSDSLIPNVAAEYNERAYDMFLMGNTEYESKSRLGYNKNIVLNGGGKRQASFR